MKSNKKNKLLKILVKKKKYIFLILKEKFITFPPQKQFIIQKIFHINGINLEKHN
jgi:hypothetical protein